MSKEELMITKEDLVNWLNRPLNNDDLDLIGFITTRLENFYKLQQENKKQKEINQKAIEYINKFKDSPEYIDAFDITYWQDEVLTILEDKEV